MLSKKYKIHHIDYLISKKIETSLRIDNAAVNPLKMSLWEAITFLKKSQWHYHL